MNSRNDSGTAPTEGSSPWHEGERMMQDRAGVLGPMNAIGRRVIRDRIGDSQRLFFHHLQFAVIGTVDQGGDAWASLLFGHEGFLQAATPTMLSVNPLSTGFDPAAAGLGDDAQIGMLCIDLATRRRHRLNGTVNAVSGSRFNVQVEQSYGNCAQYIVPRCPVLDLSGGDRATHAFVGAELDERSRAFIRRADTLFVASYVETEEGRRQVDVSHKAGPVGFVQIEGEALTVPDYSGNLFFNTLGNILLNPRCGLLFVDFETGDLLQLTGDAQVLRDGLGTSRFEGAERLWIFQPRRVVLRENALPLPVFPSTFET